MSPCQDIENVPSVIDNLLKVQGRMTKLKEGLANLDEDEDVRPLILNRGSF